MTKDKLLTLLTDRAKTAAASLGLIIWGVELLGGNRLIARIFIEHAGRASNPETPDSVTIDECAEISRLVGLALDVDDALTGTWILEVSSPGFERLFFSLDQMKPYLGQRINVLLSAPLPDWQARKKFHGLLESVGENEFVMDLSGTSVSEAKSVKIPWSFVRRAHLTHEFIRPDKPGHEKKKDRKNLEKNNGIKRK
jgi:ribosome maturation factor RimP